MLIFFWILFIGISGWISWTDYKQHAIYDFQQLLLLVPVVGIAIIQQRVLEMLSGIALGLAVNSVIAASAYLIYKAETYGIGDVLLHGCIAGFLGPAAYVNYFIIAIIITALCSSVYFGIKYHSLNHEYPLAPWLFGCLAIFQIAGQPDIIKILS